MTAAKVWVSLGAEVLFERRFSRSDVLFARARADFFS
jgi:hypothetical protein